MQLIKKLIYTFLRKRIFVFLLGTIRFLFLRFQTKAYKKRLFFSKDRVPSALQGHMYKILKYKNYNNKI